MRQNKKLKKWAIYFAIVCSCAISFCCKGKVASTSEKTAVESLSQDTIQMNEADLSGEELHFLRLMNSVIKEDAATFAHLTSYPIIRSYPLKWIEDSADMVKFFPILVDDSLKTVLRKTSPKDWEQAGWRGYTFGNGEYFWDDGDALTAINYISKKEKAMRDQLISRELASIHPSLKVKTMAPHACFYDTKSHAIYRIDILGATDFTDENAKFRMAVYLKGTDLGEKPDYLLDVDFEVEGTIGNLYYQGSDGKGNSISFDDELDEENNGYVAEVKLGKKTEKHILQRAYWLDFFDSHQEKSRK